MIMCDLNILHTDRNRIYKNKSYRTEHAKKRMVSRSLLSLPEGYIIYSDLRNET